jgi:PPM family protein phosphatase
MFAVADGMGGHAAGEVASQLTADELTALGHDGNATGERLVGAVRTANTTIFRRSLADPNLRGMGTTVCALTLVDSTLAIVNVGDSRVYTVRNGALTQVSKDHSYVAELVDAGEITWTQARSHPNRNIVTRALGIEPDVAVDLFEIPAVLGDRFLLCSDGLVDEVEDVAIAQLLSDAADPQKAANDLVDLANHNGGHDNISVVVVDVVDGDQTALAPPSSGPTTGSTSGIASSANSTGQHRVQPQPLHIAPHQPSGEQQLGQQQSSHDQSGHAQPTGEPSGQDAATKRNARSAGKQPLSKPARRRRLANRVRAVFFLALLTAIVGTIIGGVNFYGKAGAYVGFDGDNVSVFTGKRTGVLWVHPKLVQKTPLTKVKLSLDAQTRVTNTVTFSDKAAALAYIDALGKNPTLAPGNMPATTTTAPTTTTTTTTVAPTTTTPTTVPGP